MIGGRLEASGFPGVDSVTLALHKLKSKAKRDDWRYINAMTVNYQPHWFPGLSVGGVRGFTLYGGNFGHSYRTTFPLFEPFFKVDVGGEVADTTGTDQVASVLNQGCFKLRIQAKKIKIGSNHYNELTRNNLNGYQIDLLLNSSAEQNFYPIYTIYGHSEGVEKCNLPPQPIVLHICSAQDMYDMIFNFPRRRIESSDILKLTIPLECLFCCPLVHKRDNFGPKNLFEHFFQTPPRMKIDDGNNDSNNYRGYEESVPEIISTLYRFKENNDNISGLINEYKTIYPGSNGLCILKIDKENFI